MSSGFAWGLVAGLGAAALFGVAAVAQAHAVRRQDDRAHGLADFVRTSVRDPWVLGVVAAYLLGFVLHVVAIWELPLYLAQATIAASLPVTALTSAWLLGERMLPVSWVAVGLVSLGLVLLAVGSGEPGEAFSSVWFAVVMWLGVVALLALARLGLHWPGALIAALAGLGYTGSAIAVRGAEQADGVGIAAALTVGIYGLLGFWLYSVALDRTPVSSASAPLIVVQTFLPSFIGVALLGDGVREGWWPAVVLGLALSTLGAVILARHSDSAATASDEGRGEPQPNRPGGGTQAS